MHPRDASDKSRHTRGLCGAERTRTEPRFHGRTYVVEGAAKEVQEDNVADVGFQRRILDEAPAVEPEDEDADGLGVPLSHLPPQSAQWAWVRIAVEVAGVFPDSSDATP